MQYFTGLPEVLVGLHVLGACLVWIATLFIPPALRSRGAVPTADRVGPSRYGTNGSSATSRNSSARYVIDPWKSRIAVAVTVPEPAAMRRLSR